MDRRLHNEDFEKLLRDKANQYRMYPSEKVWKGIYSNLHTRRRWFGITILSMLVITGSLVSLIILNNDSGADKIASVKNVQGSAILLQQSITQKQKDNKKNLLTLNDQNKVTINNNGFIKTQELMDGAFEISNITEPDTDDLNTANEINETESLPVYTDKLKKEIAEKKLIQFPDLSTSNLLPAKIDQSEENNSKEISNINLLNESLSALASYETPVIKTSKAPKVTAQVYITPTISYRKLSDNKYYPSNQPFGLISATNIRKAVNHKPAIGFEFGITGRFRINDRMYFKSGLQFNITRYDIKAYSHPTEIATINLNTGYYNRDYVSALSNYRNYSGYSPNWLENFYFQVALPVGGELILAKNKNTSFGISGTLQPTYVIGDRAYLISSDYKNYAKVPNLMRRWNLSTAVETYVGYNTGRINWQVGPQVRYQLLSSFVSEYPIKENLFDIGIKIAAQLGPKK